MQKAWTAVAVMVPALALGGCALPPAVAIASYSADIVSYAATGKTVTDHAYSAVARSDCSFIRILHATPICVDAPAQTRARPSHRAIRSCPTRRRKRRADAPELTSPSAASANRQCRAPIGPLRGFPRGDRAGRGAGEHFQRVIAGPLSRDEATALKEKIIAAASDARHRASG